MVEDRFFTRGLFVLGAIALMLSACDRGGSSRGSGSAEDVVAPDETAVCTDPSLPQTEALLALTNQLRTNNDLSVLTYSAQLQAAAQSYAEILAAGAKLDHIGPEGDTVFDRVKATGYMGKKIGENLAGGQSQATTVIENWENSPTHRVNLLSAQFSQVGLGYAEGEGTFGKYWVQVFGDGRCD